MFRSTVLLVSLLSLAASAGDYTLDKDETHLGFEVSHLKFAKAKGQFNEFAGGFKLDDKNQTLLALSGTAKTASIDTNNEKRDKHLRSPDFFDADKFPELKAEVSGLKIAAGQTAKADVSLTIHGVTKKVPAEITFLGTMKDPWGTEKAAVSAMAVIDRKDFGLTWNQTLEAGGLLVGEQVTLEINIEGKQAPVPAKK